MKFFPFARQTIQLYAVNVALRSRTQEENPKTADQRITLAFLGKFLKAEMRKPSPSQLQQLQKYFEISQYLNEDSRSKLVKESGLCRKQINKWFGGKRHEKKNQR